MKLLIIDAAQAALSFAVYAQNSGHSVKYFVRENDDGTPNPSGDGIVTKVDKWESSMDWADLIFTSDNAFYIDELEPFFKKNYPIFGCNKAGGILELDRDFGLDQLRKVGVKTLPGTEFTSIDKAIEFVAKTQGRYVSKPYGIEDKSLTYVAKSARDMIYMLQKWKASGVLDGYTFILQEFVGGVEVAVGGWYSYTSGFSHQFFENWEHKKLCNDDLGPATGEMGTVGRYVTESPMADLLLIPLMKYLKSIKYIGYIDVNCIVDESGNIWPLEFTMRPGWPTFQLQMGLLAEGFDFVDWMKKFVDGTDERLLVTADTGICVVVAIPDYPYSLRPIEEVSGIPLYTKGSLSIIENIKHYHISDVKMGLAPEIVDNKLQMIDTLISAGTYLIIVVGSGANVDAARQSVYSRVDNLQIPNSVMYRTDIGVGTSSDIKKLHKLGVVIDSEFSTQSESRVEKLQKLKVARDSVITESRASRVLKLYK